MQANQTNPTDHAIFANQDFLANQDALTNQSILANQGILVDTNILTDRSDLCAQAVGEDGGTRSAATDDSQPSAASDQRNTILAELNWRIHELDAMAATAEQTVAGLFYRWGSAKYRSYSGRLEATKNPADQSDVIVEMRRLSDALHLAESFNNDQPRPRGLAEIKDAATCIEQSGESQHQLRSELSSFLVRHVHQIVQRTEVSIMQLECSKLSQMAPDEIRAIIRWHANQVLDLLEVLPDCDVARTTDEIGLIMSVVQQSTVKKLNALASQESGKNRRQGFDLTVDLAA
ncbi:MAG: hypothetical protein ACR2PG_05760 [Hyphomicrobiaceae bacterium]